MIVTVHQPQYIPWLGYFHKIYLSDIFVFLDDVQYKKREYQSRNRIKVNGGPIWLTVPVLQGENAYPALSDIRIDNEQDWRKKHWRSIYLNYKKAPYFKDYSGFFEDLYIKEWDKLNELNIHIVKYVLSCLGIKKTIRRSSEFGIETFKTERIIEICKALKADSYLTGAGGRAYLDTQKLEENSIRLIYQDYIHPVYKQLNMKDGKDFISHLSIIDLLFNYGHESFNVLIGQKADAI